MLTSSYPRFPGDGIGSFMEPIARGVARERDVHVVAPWHPAVRRPPREDGVQFHFFRYAPAPSLHVFGYAGALKADVALRPQTYLATPFAVVSGCSALRRVIRKEQPELVHAHWVVPSGVMTALARVSLPLVISLHGSDVYLAEKNRWVRTAARAAFRRADAVTACSEDLRRRAIDLGARAEAVTVVPYGVDTDRFEPNLDARTRLRKTLGTSDEDRIIFAGGRLVRKKGFEYLVDAMAIVAERWPRARLVIAGGGDLDDELRARIASHNISDRVTLTGALPQGEVAAWLSAADVTVVPSVRDDAGNVDGLPNALLEALSSGTPVVATPAGGIESVAVDGQTARVIPERDAAAIAGAIDDLWQHPESAAQLGRQARELMSREFGWDHTVARFEEAYAQAVQHRAAGPRRA